MGDVFAATAPPVSSISMKLQRPQLPEPTLARPRIAKALRRASGLGITSVVAPAGFGKTIAVAHWLSLENPDRSAWLSLGPEDGQALQFWRHFADAVSVVEPDALVETRRHLAQGKTTSGYAFIAMMINELCATRLPFTLVLDNLEQLTDASLANQLASLIESFPPNVQTMLVSRVEPELPVSRWRAHGRLSELIVEDLRFTNEEAHGYLDLVIAGEITLAQQQTVVDRTDGWAAGLYLAALGARSSSNRDAFVAGFGTTDDTVGEYVVGEVLDGLPSDVRRFLLMSSLLDTMSPEACDAVTGGTNASRVLPTLRNHGVFVERAESRGLWKYHPLFRDVLRSLLDQDSTSSERAAAHRNAARAYAANGRFIDALEHAVEAADHAYAEAILEDEGIGLLESSPERTQHLLAALPHGSIAKRPRIDALRHWSAAVLGDVETLEQISAREPDGPEADLAPAADVAIAYLEGDLDRLTERLPAAEDVMHDQAILSARAFVAMHNGDYTDATALLVESQQREVRNPFTAIVALSLLAWTHVVEGKLSDGLAYAVDAIELADDKGIRWFHGVRWAEIARAHVDFDRGNLDDAYRHAAPITDTVNIDALAQVDAHILMARICWALGRREAATAKLAEITVSPICRVDGRVRDRVNMTHALLRLLDRDIELAQAWMPEWRTRLDRDSGSETERLMLARLYAGTGHCEKASSVLGSRMTSSFRSIRCLIEAQKLRAIYAAAMDDPSAPMKLEVAVTMARTEGFAQTFVDDAAALATIRQPKDRLLREPSADQRMRPENSHAARAATRSAVRYVGLVEPLTERELAVLRYLPTRLSNHEIADELFVSINTVKSHMRAIYRKLEVNRRNDAVSKAVSCGLV